MWGKNLKVNRLITDTLQKKKKLKKSLINLSFNYLYILKYTLSILIIMENMDQNA